MYLYNVLPEANVLGFQPCIYFLSLPIASPCRANLNKVEAKMTAEFSAVLSKIKTANSYSLFVNYC
jgi:hypothetical protein